MKLFRELIRELNFNQIKILLNLRLIFVFERIFQAIFGFSIKQQIFENLQNFTEYFLRILLSSSNHT